MSVSSSRRRVLPRRTRGLLVPFTLPAPRVSGQAVLIVLLLVSFAAARAQQTPTELTVWNFDHSHVNSLGGKYNVFMRNPSWARSYLDPGTHRPSSAHSLRFTAHRAAQGFCGIWFDFYPGSESPVRYVDASAYRYLSFWIKGEKGGEDVDITLKDSTWRAHEDSNPTRPLHAYLPQGASTGWQQVRIPLRDFQGLDATKLFNLVFVITREGDHRFYVDDIGFTSGKSPGRVAETLPANPAPAATPANSGRALWVWNTVKLLDPSHRPDLDRFFEFCARQGVKEIFLSLDIRLKENTATPVFELKEPARYREFLDRAHQAGLQVQALAGTSEWAARANHAQAVAAIDSVIDFNHAGPAAARFDGVHFDVEPYSLVGYADPALRPRLLEEFLEMVAKCAERARTEPGLRFGCDVPAWFYTNDDLARQDLLVNFRGQEKTVGEHLTDLLDAVTIMDYRNQADGAGGIILAGMPAIEYAASKGRKIQVGLETSIEPDRTIYFVAGLPLGEFQKRLAASDLRNQLYFGGYRLATFSDEINVHTGLAAPDHLEGAAQTEFEKALAKLALELGASSDPEAFPAGPILEEAQGGLARDPEMTGFETFRFADPETQRAITGFKTVRRMSPKITFHGLSREVFNEETRSVVEWLSPFASFQGLAIHYYESYRELVEDKQ